MATSGGAAISAYTEVLQETTPVFLGGEESIVNAATRQTHTLSHIIDPRDRVKMMRMLQGGTDIRDIIYLEKKGAFSNYLLGAEHTYDNPQGKTTWSVPWRMSTGHYSFEDFEVEINVNGSEDEKILKIKDILYSKQMDAVTTYVEGLDDQFWTPANTLTMEAAGGIDPYSLTAFINEFQFGQPQASNQPGGNWTTIMGINPTALPNWRPAQQGYSAIGTVASAAQFGRTHLFEAFKRIVMKTEFHGMPYRPDLAEAPTSPGVIFASMVGHGVYEQALQQNQDTFVYAGRRSPHYDNAQGFLDYRGIPMVYIQAKDSAAIYPTGALDALGIETSTANATHGLTDTAGNAIGYAGPRYEFMNGKYMLKVFHKNRYFYQTPAFRPSERPFTNVVVYDCWHNNVCRNRRVQGSVYPIAKDYLTADDPG